MESRKDKNAVDASATAMLVAQAYYASADYNGFAPDHAKQLVKYIIASAKHNYPLSAKWVTQLYEVMPVCVGRLAYSLFKVKNYPGYIASRKAYIDQTVEQAIADGAEQVLVIGGGFDVMATMKHKLHSGVQFFELDRGPHRQMKLDALNDLRTGKFSHHDVERLAEGLQHDGDIHDNMHFIEADLSRPDWQGALLKHHFDPMKKTVCIAEGLTMYLTVEEIKSWLAIMRKLLSDESNFVFSFFDTDSRNNTSKINDAILSRTNERFKTRIAAVDVPAFMFDCGFSVIERLPRESIQHSLGLPDSEMYLIVNMPENYFKAAPKKPDAVLQPYDQIPLACSELNTSLRPSIA